MTNTDLLKNDNNNNGKDQHSFSVDKIKFFNKNKNLFQSVTKTLQNLPAGMSVEDIYCELGITPTTSYSFTLKNGNTVECDLITFNGSDEILAKTVVHPDNGRDQHGLTRDALMDIIPSLEEAGQLYPGVAFLDSNGQIVVLDSSRRRQALIFIDGVYKLWVARTPLTPADARYVADVSRLTKARSYREIGIELQDIMIRNEISGVRDLASYVGNSRETVRLQINAASIPHELCSIVPMYNSMGKNEWAMFYKIYKPFTDEALDIESIKNKLSNELGDFSVLNVNDEDEIKSYQNKILLRLHDVLSENNNNTSNVEKPRFVPALTDKPNLSKSVLIKESSTNIDLRFAKKVLTSEKREQLEVFLSQLFLDA